MLKLHHINLLQRLLKSQAAALDAEGKRFPVSPDHHFAMVVPKGGSSCAKCVYVSEDGKSCSNEYYIEHRGGDGKLPAPADEYCCDEYKTTLVSPERQRAAERTEPKGE